MKKLHSSPNLTSWALKFLAWIPALESFHVQVTIYSNLFEQKSTFYKRTGLVQQHAYCFMLRNTNVADVNLRTLNSTWWHTVSSSHVFFILILIGHWQVTILMPQFCLQTTATGGVLHFSDFLNPYRLPRSHWKPTHIWELNKLITYIKGWFLFSFLLWSVWVFLKTCIFKHVWWKGLSISTKLRPVLKVL